MADSDSDESVKHKIMDSKKRKRTGRMSEVSKNLKLSTHEAGQPCNCVRLKCFVVVNKEQRKRILKNFNGLLSHDEQNSYLAGLMTVMPVKQRRPRQNETTATLHDASYSYRVRVHDRDIPVCAKAFCSMHGITKNKLIYIKESLKLTGAAPKDKRGKHSAIHRKLDDLTKRFVCDHIKSFKGRQSHYSLKDTKKTYLPEELTIKKMFNLFKEMHPNAKVSYETYRTIFNKEFNISFGYPRSDTCAVCDEFQIKVKSLSAENDKDEIRKLTVMNELHKRKAEAFYSRKREAKRAAKKSNKKEAICIDFAKNISIPKISTNDVYYKRQLSMYAFNVHVLSSGQSVFYTYHEGFAKKGSNEVASFLFHFINTYLEDDIEELQIFCDSAGGQNKNFTIFRFIHFIVNNRIHGLKQIKITFPVRGHSYLECDKNVGLWNLKSPYETPEEFEEVIKNSRCKPSPFIVVSVSHNMILDWKSFLDTIYLQKCPFKIQILKEIVAISDHSRLMYHRATYNGPVTSGIIRKCIDRNTSGLRNGEFVLPAPAYDGKL